MVAKWFCCRCKLLNESTHHNAVFCFCRHHVCGSCRHAKLKKSSQNKHHNHDLHKRKPHGATSHKTNATHHHNDTLHELSVQIGANVVAGIVVAAASAAATSAACSIM
jgi:hypothetical protein